MADNRDDLRALIRATLEKVFEVSREFVENKNKIDELRKRADALEEENKTVAERFEDCYRTAKLFDFDLNAEAARYTSEANELAYGPSEPGVPVVGLIHAEEKVTIQSYIAKAAETAYPNPVRASVLRRELEERGIKTHEKTVGMTLYRLSQKRVLERRGKANWFFIPEGQRLSALAEEKENPGGNPGLLQLAE